MKEQLLTLIKEQAKNIKVEENLNFTATNLAQKLNVSRNVVSQYLNELVLNDDLIKIVSRPVYFFPLLEVEEIYNVCLRKTVFGSFDEFNEYISTANSDFHKLIGGNGSLKHIVEQCKAAISYPPNGLPILIHGPTGTGKSFIASLMYEYAINNQIIDPKSKFVSINCSEYANNPELITANLFGHKKGAFTGADKDNVGLIHLADHGVLFLDEVHCLKAECQEKLFQLMDKGIYHMVGDNENYHTSACRIIFATTENPEEVLLSTLLRRIPIVVDIIGLNERPKVEKKALIYSVFQKESLKIKKDIAISKLVFQTLMNITINGNVGGLKNCIKAACANAFLNNQIEDNCLMIYVYNLPDNILSLMHSISLKDSKENNQSMIWVNKVSEIDTSYSLLLSTYELMLNDYLNYVKSAMNYYDFIEQLIKSTTNFNDLALNKEVSVPSPNIDYLNKIVDKIFSIVINRYSLKISNNLILMFAKYLLEYSNNDLNIINWRTLHYKEIATFVALMNSKYPKESNIALEISNNCRINLDITLDDMGIIVLIVYILSANVTTLESNVIGLILCHGYSTASSIAATANKLLGQYIFDAIDMELNMSNEKMMELVNKYLLNHTNYSEICLLVDMGSLEDVHKELASSQHCNVGIINNVTTRMALQIGSGIQNKIPIEHLLKKTVDNIASSYHYIKSISKTNVILCTCSTGLGSAEKIIELLISSLPNSIPVEFLAYDYQNLLENSIENGTLEKYNILFIVGTLNPNIEGIPYIAVEQLILNNNLDMMSTIFANFLSKEDINVFNQNILKNFTLNNIVNHLTILNAQKVLEDVEEVVVLIEKNLAIQIELVDKVGLYMHLACLIERLMMRLEIQEGNDLEEFRIKNKDFIDKIKDSFSVVGYRYSVEIPDAEIMYIHNYLRLYSK